MKFLIYCNEFEISPDVMFFKLFSCTGPLVGRIKKLYRIGCVFYNYKKWAWSVPKKGGIKESDHGGILSVGLAYAFMTIPMILVACGFVSLGTAI